MTVHAANNLAQLAVLTLAVLLAAATLGVLIREWWKYYR